MKKVGVVVRDRQSEALRMSVGLTLADDVIEVYVMDRPLEKGNEEIDLNVETLHDLDCKVYSNNEANSGAAEILTTDQIAQKLLECDLVLPY